jgi:DNA-binding NarL/FixJ family response regulator
VTAQHPDILTVRDAEILRLLRRVADIGTYRKSFTAEQVVDVAQRWLVPRKAQVHHLRPVPPPPPPVESADEASTPVELTATQAAVVAELCKNGDSNAAIGEVLGISEETIKTHLQRAYAAMGARDRAQVVAFVLSGRVQIKLKPNGNRKKAS